MSNRVYEKVPVSMLARLEKKDMSFLEQISWFSNLGKYGDPSIQEAVKLVESLEWENFQLDRSGDTTAFLCQNNKSEYSEWNNITKEIKNYLDNSVFPLVATALEKAKLPESILSSIKWDIIAYLQEKTYEPLGIPLFYFNLIESYRNGRLPCGWDGEYPEGKLIEC